MAKKIKLKAKSINEPVEQNPGSGQSSENGHALFNPEGELVVDVFETNSEFVVLTAIAGVQIKDLDISIEKDMMVIKGQRANPHETPEKRYFYQECYWGPFSRKIVLPENINIESAQAAMDKGMLTIKIPRSIGDDKKEEIKLS